MNSQQKKKRKLKPVSIKLREDQIEKLKLMGVTSWSDFFRELAQKAIDEGTLKNDSREEQLLVLNRKADMAEKEAERLRTDAEYRKCLNALKTAERCKNHFKNALFRIGVITNDTWEKYEHADMVELSDLASKLTREQWREIATMKTDPSRTDRFFSERVHLLGEYEVNALLNWRRNKIRQEAHEKLIDQAEQRVKEGREQVIFGYENRAKNSA